MFTPAALWQTAACERPTNSATVGSPPTVLEQQQLQLAQRVLPQPRVLGARLQAQEGSVTGMCTQPLSPAVDDWMLFRLPALHARRLARSALPDPCQPTCRLAGFTPLTSTTRADQQRPDSTSALLSPAAAAAAGDAAAAAEAAAAPALEAVAVAALGLAVDASPSASPLISKLQAGGWQRKWLLMACVPCNATLALSAAMHAQKCKPVVHV